MGIITDRKISQTHPTEVWELSVFVLSKSIKPGHPFWIEMEKRGYDVYEFDGQNISSEKDGQNLLLIHDAESSVSQEYLNRIVNSGDKINMTPRILVVDAADDFMHLKREVYKCDSILKIDYENQSEMEDFSYQIFDIAVTAQSEITEPETWEDLTKLFLEDINEVNNCTNLMNDIAALGPLFREYEYTIKSLLKLLANSFNAPASALFAENDKILFTFISKPVSSDYIKLMLQTLMSNYSEISPEDYLEVTWGRRLLDTQKSKENYSEDFIIVPLNVKGQSTGKVVIPEGGEGYGDAHFMELLGHQIALLINTSRLYKVEKKAIQNDFLRMNAVNEVCQLFSDMDSKDFAVQFLLIMLEYLSAYKGILALMDENARINTVHSVGFDEKTIEWLKTENTALPWEETFRSDEAKSGIANIPMGDTNQPETSLYYIGYPLYDMHKKLGVLFILFRDAPKTQEQFQDYCQTMATLASILFANINLYEQFLEKRLMEEQINIARDIQRELLPKHTPELQDYVVAASSRSATQVGGDFYDFIAMPDGKNAIIIGDVSGKGIAASQLMSMAKSLLKFRLLQGTPLTIAMGDVNNYLAHETPAEKFVTAQAIMIDQKNKIIELVNAGHGMFQIYRSEKHDFDHIDVDGLALGIIPDMHYESKTTSYLPGDVILMYTDGLQEAMSQSREQFGIERIRNIVKEMNDSKPTDIMAKLYEAIKDHASGMPQHDDTTIIVMQAK